MSYRDLQNEIGELVHAHEWRTLRIPKVVAKVGAYVQEKLPGADPFIKPWMIDRADDHYALDITRARRLLGWQPKRSLRATLPAMIAALRADPDGWYRENKLQGSPPARESAHSTAEA
jgi:nucleoside-diphosphate-sugar epimerase